MAIASVVDTFVANRSKSDQFPTHTFVEECLAVGPFPWLVGSWSVGQFPNKLVPRRATHNTISPGPVETWAKANSVGMHPPLWEWYEQIHPFLPRLDPNESYRPIRVPCAIQRVPCRDIAGRYVGPSIGS